MVKLFVFNAFLLVLVYGQKESNRKVCLTSECLKAASHLKQRIDTSVNPCDNFYRFACGKYFTNAEIKPQYQFTSNLMEMQEKIDLQVKAVLETPYNAETEKKYIKLMKDYHAQCIDLHSIDRQGATPLIEMLKSIGEWPHLGEKWSSESFDVFERIMKLKEKAIYQSTYPLKIDVSYIPGNIMKNAFHVNVNKLHLLGSANYRKGLESELVKYEYEAMLKIADILGVDKTVAAEDLRNVQQLKVRLANAMNNGGEQTMMTIDELNSHAPNVEWRKMMEGLSDQTLNEGEKIVVNQPTDVKEINNVLATADKRTLANLMMYNLIAVVGEYVGKEVRTIVLDVRGRANGILENDLPRWKVCLMDKADILDIAISSAYVINNNFASKRDQVTKMFETIKEKFAQMLDIDENILDDDAKKLLTRKIRSIRQFLLHPDEYLNQEIVQKYYEQLNFDNAPTLLDKRLELSHFELQQMYRRLREQNDNKWQDFKYALRIGSDYVAQTNSVRMTEALFNWPIFSEGRPNYLNYGSVGFIMGHEVAQTFDVNARLYDENGKKWQWNPEPEQKYVKRTQCFVNMYDKMSVNGMNINGTQTLNENIADDIGLSMAYETYKEATANTEEASLPELPYSPDQLFWISSANVICAKFRDEYMVEYIQSNNHSPPEIRANGAMMNAQAFAEVFQCPENSYMNPKKKCVSY